MDRSLGVALLKGIRVVRMDTGHGPDIRSLETREHLGKCESEMGGEDILFMWSS